MCGGMWASCGMTCYGSTVNCRWVERDDLMVSLSLCEGLVCLSEGNGWVSTYFSLNKIIIPSILI